MIENPKFEARNSKQYQNPEYQMNKNKPVLNLA